MKRTLLYFGLIGTVMVMSAGKCSTSKAEAEQSGRYYAGKINVATDGLPSTFTDCATIITMDISDGSNDAFKQLLYNNSEEEVLYVEFLGSVEHFEGGIPGENRPIVTINSIESVGDASVCSGVTLPGIYDTNMGAEVGIPRYLLRLKPNYTFTHTIYDEQGAEIVSAGIWYRTAKGTLVLDHTDADKPHQTLEIDAEKESLSADTADQKLVYSKVYM